MKIFQKIVLFTFIIFGISLSVNAAFLNVLVEGQEVATLSLPSSRQECLLDARANLDETCALIKRGGGTLQITNLAPFSTIEIKAGTVRLIINSGEAILFDKEREILYCVQNITFIPKKSNCCLSAWGVMVQKLSCLKRFLCCCCS